MLIRLLRDEHLENNDNPEYRKILGNIASAGLRFAPHPRAMEIEAEIVRQEVEHGRIVAEMLAGLGATRSHGADQAVRLSHPARGLGRPGLVPCLIDRVGLYVGASGTSPYEPLAKVSPRLHTDEGFHATVGFRHLRQVCSTPRASGGEGPPPQVVAGGPRHVRPVDSKGSPTYVKWGIKAHERKAAPQIHRRHHPQIVKLGLRVPDDPANRRFL